MTSDFDEAAQAVLHRALGPSAMFREGQLEAIEGLVEQRGRLLVVQRTGWGKSAVYFVATAMLRERGAGPTILVSPHRCTRTPSRSNRAAFAVSARSAASASSA